MFRSAAVAALASPHVRRFAIKDELALNLGDKAHDTVTGIVGRVTTITLRLGGTPWCEVTSVDKDGKLVEQWAPMGRFAKCADQS